MRPHLQPGWLELALAETLSSRHCLRAGCGECDPRAFLRPVARELGVDMKVLFQGRMDADTAKELAAELGRLGSWSCATARAELLLRRLLEVFRCSTAHFGPIIARAVVGTPAGEVLAKMRRFEAQLEAQRHARLVQIERLREAKRELHRPYQAERRDLKLQRDLAWKSGGVEAAREVARGQPKRRRPIFDPVAAG